MYFVGFLCLVMMISSCPLPWLWSCGNNLHGVLPYTTESWRNEILEFSNDKNLDFRIFRPVENLICVGGSARCSCPTLMHLDVEINKRRAALRKGKLAEKRAHYYDLAKLLYKKHVQQVCFFLLTITNVTHLLNYLHF